MTYLQRLQALLPEYAPDLVERCLGLLRQGIPPDEVRFCLGLGPDYALMAREVLRVSWFLVMHRFARIEVVEPLQVERGDGGYTVMVNGQRLQLSETDALALLAELYMDYQKRADALE